MSHSREGELVLNGRYRILRMIQAGVGDTIQHVGESGHCRFCGCTGPDKFRTVAHTFPEALGNRWVVSDDECDDCNQRFSIYDDALASALRPFLTLGGTGGKSGVPQTGRSAGDSVIRHGRVDGRRQIAVMLKNVAPEDHVQVSPDGRYVRFQVPVEGIKFRPRRAYKALSKIGLALMPTELLPEYSKLLAWLQQPEDQTEFPVLEVGLSFGSIGNAPPVVCAVLLQRTEPSDPIPHLYLLFCSGSVCTQLALMSDHLEDHLPPVKMGSVNVGWNAVLGPEQEIRIHYGNVWPFNWTAQETKPQPVESFVLDFDTVTTAGIFTPQWRPQIESDKVDS
jgi:hypothetical protein